MLRDEIEQALSDWFNPEVETPGPLPDTLHALPALEKARAVIEAARDFLSADGRIVDCPRHHVHADGCSGCREMDKQTGQADGASFVLENALAAYDEQGGRVSPTGDGGEVETHSPLHHSPAPSPEPGGNAREAAKAILGLRAAGITETDYRIRLSEIEHMVARAIDALLGGYSEGWSERDAIDQALPEYEHVHVSGDRDECNLAERAETVAQEVERLTRELADAHGVAQACEARAEQAERERDEARAAGHDLSTDPLFLAVVIRAESAETRVAELEAALRGCVEAMFPVAHCEHCQAGRPHAHYADANRCQRALAAAERAIGGE
jgi:hypothetical protein